MDEKSTKRAWIEDAENRKRAKSALATGAPTNFTSLAIVDLTEDDDNTRMAIVRPTPCYPGAPSSLYDVVGQYREPKDDDDDDLGDTQADTENIEFVASQAIMDMTQTQPFSQDMVCLRLKLHSLAERNLCRDSIEKFKQMGLYEIEFSLLSSVFTFGRDNFTTALVGKYERTSLDIVKLSKKHCVLECKEDATTKRTEVYITDTSTNGTKLNGERLVKGAPQVLRHDDKITLLSSQSGSVLLGYTVEDPHVIAANATVPASSSRNTKRHIQENVLGVLFSSPLVGRDALGGLHPIEELDLCREYDNLTQTLEEASKYAITKPDNSQGVIIMIYIKTRVVMLVPREIDLNVQFATSINFQTMMTLGCRALHFSGHGSPKCLYFEDQESAVHPMSTEELRRFHGGSSSPLRLVVVQACHSQYCATAFLACGIPHVIAVKVEERLEDQAAIVFTKNFYLGLGQGKSVAESFDIGRNSVATFPHLAHAAKVCKVYSAASKFQLLPEGNDHSEIIFPMIEMPLEDYQSQVPVTDRFPTIWSSKLPSVCQHFRHRETDQYYICAHFSMTNQSQRFVWIVGPAGVGKTQLSYSVARYLGARKYFPAGIKFVYVSKLADDDMATHNNNTISLGPRVFSAIKNRVQLWLSRAFDEQKSTSYFNGLLVLDGVDALLGREENDFMKWIETICTQYSSLRLIVTARKQVVSSVFQIHAGRMQHIHSFKPGQAVDLLRRLIGKQRSLQLSGLTKSPIWNIKNHPDPNINLSLVLEQHPALRQTQCLPQEIANLASQLIASPNVTMDDLVAKFGTNDNI
ncbi:hypothetical protein THRCLA_06423 [Thraustotheca clavata]|uniref:FHA domain-containing protein n=1 Tax=Thraustotheca clavata TaxID=74557 RepID=A0A1V9ZNY6_9STRA|nr:hypothetical protein THRCLA_06423 [Thraustotheca clavata]